MNFLHRFWKWFDDRTGAGAAVIPAAVHPVPRHSRWFYVFGSATLIAFIVQVVTGIALATTYTSTADHAYDSLHYISTGAPFGHALRGIHYFGASAMVLLVGIHMIRVYLMAAYKYPREMNWVSGVLLLVFTLGMGFTGQLLRWDQTAVWSTVVASEQAARVPFIGKQLIRVVLAGSNVGSATLGRFYILHVFVLPALIILFIGMHMYLVLYHGISAPPEEGEVVDPATARPKYHALLKRDGVPFWPFAAWRDVLFGLLVVVAIVALGCWFGPPILGNPPDPALLRAEPQPDWYLLWYFAVLALIPHEMETPVILGFPVVVGLVLIAVPFIANRGERSLKRRPWDVLIVIVVVTFIGVLWRAGVEQRWSPKFDAVPVPASVGGAASGPVHDGAAGFNTRGCLYCHMISDHGGTRGPDLTFVGDRLTHEQIVIRIVNGGYNMPAYATNMSPKELSDVAAFLMSRKKN